jgi:hypothetical protein
MIIHLIWIIALISFILYLIKEYKEYGTLKTSDYFISFMVSLLVAVVTFGCIIIISLIIDHNTNKELIVTDTKTIYALNDTNSINGQAFLFSGYIKEDLVYRMFVEDNGGKKLKELNPSSVTIYEEDDSCNKIIETYKYQYTNGFIIWLLGKYTWDDTIYNIHIPKGSITTEYKLDLK